MQKIIGSFTQLLTMANLPERGAIKDKQLEIIENGGVVVEGGEIIAVGEWKQLVEDFPTAKKETIGTDMVLLPGFIDAHTHICSAGNRARDYAMRLEGKTYLEIAEAGGGIWHTVTATRNASREELEQFTKEKALEQLRQGITTCEVKSGYGLSVESELKMLEVIREVEKKLPIDLVATCLAAHMKPIDFEGNNEAYLQMLIDELLPRIKKEKLSKRVDIFVEKSAFGVEESRYFLEKAKEMGFEITVHADQFTTGGSQLAVDLEAASADHLEASGEKEVKSLAQSNVVAVALPGASLGLGDKFTPARKLLDAGGVLAIASDWNPGSAPMGKLLTQASILGVFEQLSMAEVLAAITVRGARALRINNRGVLAKGYLADMVAFPCKQFAEILYRQGALEPVSVWKRGDKVL